MEEHVWQPQTVANSILAGSKFSIVYVRNLLYFILEEGQLRWSESTNVWTIWRSARWVAKPR